MIKNTYLDIAENDLQYLESVIAMGNTFYNQLAVQCQQVAEKYLKGYLDKIASKLNEVKAGLELDTIGLAYLTDFYYDARYPGDDFYNVTKDDFEKCLSIMYDTVNKLRKGFGN